MRRKDWSAAIPGSDDSLFDFCRVIRQFSVLFAGIAGMAILGGCMPRWHFPDWFGTGRPPGKGYEYRVIQGDTLWAISRKTGVDVNTLARNNRLKNPDQLEVGQVLWVPGEKKAVVSSSPRISQSATGGRPIKPKPTPRPTPARIVRRTETRNPVQSSQKMIWPIQGKWTISSRFGPREGGYHRGIDLVAPEGTPVVAVWDGVVTYAGTEKSRVGKILGFGNHIYISHSNGLITIYAHNRVNLVNSGDKVKQGQKIAEVGNTGYTRGPNGYHLHFEVRNQETTEAENPEKYLPPR
jgi:murein DD-endopeptidase MepM/ murein hydrolase activator NlpD